MTGEAGVEDVGAERCSQFVAKRVDFLTRRGIAVQIDDGEWGAPSIRICPADPFLRSGHDITQPSFGIVQPLFECRRPARQVERCEAGVESMDGTCGIEQTEQDQGADETDGQAAYHAGHPTSAGRGVSGLRAPDWQVEGADWPNRHCSRFVEAAGLRWHVQEAGQGAGCLLVHGTGAATHSFRDLLPMLARHFRVVAIDLPGHGFTTRPLDNRDLSLPAMAAALAQLLDALGFAPDLVVGHSAGAAILCRMALDQSIRPRELISLNGALLPLSGFKHPAITPLVRAIASSQWVSRFFARRLESPREVERMLAATGSQLDERGTQLYGRLSRCPSHAGAALAMMAVWDVRPIEQQLGRLPVPLTLVAGARDRMILPGEAARVQRLLPQADVVQFADLGHLAHEERPELVGSLIIEHARQRGLPIPS